MTKPLGIFEIAVLLAVLHLENEAYGVPIRAELSRRLGRPVSLGAVYTTLDRLLQKGLVGSRWGAPTAVRGGRAKKFFTVEQRGLRALDTARAMVNAIGVLEAVVSR